MKKIEYIGIFFEADKFYEIENVKAYQRLFRTIDFPHVTVKYKPDEIPLEFFGQKVVIKCVGYGKDEENEAFFVEFVEYPDGMEDLIKEIQVPHITLSVSEKGKAVNSGSLEFSDIAEPFCVEGVFGGMDYERNLITSK